MSEMSCLRPRNSKAAGLRLQPGVVCLPSRACGQTWMLGFPEEKQRGGALPGGLGSMCAPPSALPDHASEMVMSRPNVYS